MIYHAPLKRDWMSYGLNAPEPAFVMEDWIEPPAHEYSLTIQG